MIVKNLWISFVFIVSSLLCFSSIASAKQPLHNSSFLTPRDISSTPYSSNIKLQNNGNTAKVVYGIYIRQFSFVAPGQSCANPEVMYDASENVAAGSVVMPVTIAAKGGAPVGANYLYNMIYNSNYYVAIAHPSASGCLLPGCTWPTDLANYNWCIYLGALSPVLLTAGYAANVPPSTAVVSIPSQYDYNLVSTYHYLGPISCNDQTLTCSVATPQSQAFS